MYSRTVAWVGFVGWAAAGCGPVVAADDGSTGGAEATAGPTGDADASASAADATSSTPGTTTTSTTTAGTTATTTASTNTDPTDPTDDVTFITGGGDWGSIDECSLWEQDCPKGEKCMPWANDGGSSWNATRCSPIDANPHGPGEPCTVEGSGVSGIDDCELGAMCWNVDPETNMGVCVAFCIGDEANPFCANECDQCNIGGDSVLILCLPQCDPIAQDCGEGLGCYPDFQSFSCAPDASGEAGAVGEPCEFLNVCNPGSACVTPDLAPGCEGATGCCAPFCDVDGPPVCADLLPGSSCVPWWEEGQPPEACVGGATIGVCALPG